MFPKKYSNLLFILVMGFGMSLLMTLIITYINTGMDNEYVDRFFKAWSVSLPIAIIAALLVGPPIKNTVIALREIAEENIKVNELTESAVYKLRKHVEQVDDGAEDDEDVGDDFESLYKGEISKSGTPILPSKRARKTPEKIQVSNEDLAELSQTAKPDIDTAATDETGDEQGDVSLDEVTETENQATDQDTSNEAENN